MYVGEEAVAAGVCANLDDDDYVTSTHRGHGHCIAKGCDLDRMMAEIYGREDGLCKGRGGSMHIADFSRGMLGANAIVGGGIALATGAGLASQRARQRPGRGRVLRRRRREPGRAAREPQPGGDLEAAGDLRLREQRLRRVDARRSYATSVPDVALARGRATASRASSPTAPTCSASTRPRERPSSARARGEGPTLLEVKTYRFMGHFEGDPDRYRDDDERQTLREQRRDRRASREQLARARAMRPTPSSTRSQRRASRRRSTDAVEFARASPFPDPAEIGRYVYPEQLARVEARLMAVATERTLSLVDAVGEAMRQAMEADPT